MLVVLSIVVVLGVVLVFALSIFSDGLAPRTRRHRAYRTYRS